MPNAWDPAKRLTNIAKHGVDFAAAEAFDWARAIVKADTRHDYGEVRLQAIGPLNERLHLLVFTIRRNTTWIISLRRANDKEIIQYGNEV